MPSNTTPSVRNMVTSPRRRFVLGVDILGMPSNTTPSVRNMVTSPRRRFVLGVDILGMPSNTTSSVLFHYVYVLESLKDFNRYIGYTANLKRRLEEHKNAKSFSTKFRLPLKLVYFEGCINEQDAKRREHYLKTTQGRRFLGLRLTEYKRQRTAFGAGS